MFALVGLGLGVHTAQGQTLNRWIQYGPNNTVLARAITSGTVCPALSVDGTAVTLNQRSAPNSTFPVLECEASIGMGHTSAVLDGVQMKLPTPNPRRIVVVGDTGCRLKGTSIQACNDPSAFPLARISNFVASFVPDLIVHVGDTTTVRTPAPPPPPAMAPRPAVEARPTATSGRAGTPTGSPRRRP
jgi:hypothetical protein